jgi:hypothetical protein
MNELEMVGAVSSATHVGTVAGSIVSGQTVIIKRIDCTDNIPSVAEQPCWSSIG